MHEAFRAESGAVISPHALCSPESRVHEYSGTRDALRLEQADGSVSASRGSGQRNASCGLPHPAGPDVRGGPSFARVTAGTASQRDMLTNELKRYEYQISPSGNITYGVPDGYHDDCVMALALANHRRWEQEELREDAAGRGCGA